MDLDIKEQLISTIMKTFAYSKIQADYLFIQLMNCVSNKELVMSTTNKQRKKIDQLLKLILNIS